MELRLLFLLLLPVVAEKGVWDDLRESGHEMLASVGQERPVPNNTADLPKENNSPVDAISSVNRRLRQAGQVNCNALANESAEAVVNQPCSMLRSTQSYTLRVTKVDETTWKTFNTRLTLISDVNIEIDGSSITELNLSGLTSIDNQSIVVSKNDELDSVRLPASFTLPNLEISKNFKLTLVEPSDQFSSTVLVVSGNPGLPQGILTNMNTSAANSKFQKHGECIFDEPLNNLTVLNACKYVEGPLKFASGTGGEVRSDHKIEEVNGDIYLADLPLDQLQFIRNIVRVTTNKITSTLCGFTPNIGTHKIESPKCAVTAGTTIPGGGGGEKTSGPSGGTTTGQPSVAPIGYIGPPGPSGAAGNNFSSTLSNEAIGIIAGCAVLLLAAIVIIVFCCIKRKKKASKRTENQRKALMEAEEQKKALEEMAKKKALEKPEDENGYVEDPQFHIHVADENWAKELNEEKKKKKEEKKKKKEEKKKKKEEKNKLKNGTNTASTTSVDGEKSGTKRGRSSNGSTTK